MNTIYLPELTRARVVRAFRWGALPDSYCCVLVTDCQSEGPVRYAHVMFVHRGALSDPACFAVAAEVNKQAAPGSGRSHFLGVFHGKGGPMHENLGGSDEWADLDRFTVKALKIVAERFSLSSYPEELTLTDQAIRTYKLPGMFLPLQQRHDLQIAERQRNKLLTALSAIGLLLLVILGYLFVLLMGVIAILSGYLAIAQPNKDTPWLCGIGLVCGLLAFSAYIGLNALGKPRAAADQAAKPFDSIYAEMVLTLRMLGISRDLSAVSDEEAASVAGLAIAFIFRGYKLLEAGQADEAINILAEAIDLLADKGEKYSEEHAAACYLRGYAYEHKQMVAQAQENYTSALRLAPNLALARQGLGRINYVEGPS